MAYLRVVPRDLFNEANLLKCYGALWILLDHQGHRAVLSEGDGSPFEIVQNEHDGSLTVANLPFTIADQTWHLSRPLNSRRSYPLYASKDDEVVEVFTDQGQLTEEFTELIWR